GFSQALGTRWRLAAGVAGSTADSDQIAFRPTQGRRLVEGAGSFDELAGTVALARSPSPDLTQAVLFVPISQSLVGSDLYGNRILAASANTEVAYLHSTRLATVVHGSYTSLRRIASSQEPGQASPFPDSTAETAGVGLRYRRSERTEVTAD